MTIQVDLFKKIQANQKRSNYKKKFTYAKRFYLLVVGASGGKDLMSTH